MGEINLGKIAGTQTFVVASAISTAPTGARIGDYIANGGTAALSIGGKSLEVGDYAPITTLSPLALGNVVGNMRGAAGGKGEKGDTGIISAAINENGELVLTTP